MKFKIVILNILYSLVLPFHILNTYELAGLKLYHIPVLLLAVFNFFNYKEYTSNPIAKRIVKIGFLSLVPIILCGASISGFFNYMTCILALIGLPYINKKYVFIISSSLFLVANVLAFQQSEWLGGAWRYQGLYNDPNYMVISMVVGIYMCIRVITDKNKLPFKVIATASLLFALYTILLSQSRGGLLALLLFVVVYIPEMYRRSKFITIAGFIVLLASSGSLYIRFSDNIDFIASRFRGDNISDAGAAQSRFKEINSAFNAIEERPYYLITGAGLSASSSQDGVYKNDYRIHNTIIAILYENGIISLFFFVAMAFNLIKYTFRRNKLCMSLSLALLFQCMTIWTMLFFPFWLGLFLSLDDLKTNNNHVIDM